jgi:hypothetical protein
MWFTVYFLINSVWVAGDIAYPDGWSSIYYKATKCEDRATRANIRFQSSLRTKDTMKVQCNVTKPNGWVGWVRIAD